MTNFNYNNRKLKGVNLARVVAKDLRKRIQPCSPRTDALAPIVIQLDHKEVGSDNSLEEIGAALVEALSPPDGFAATRIAGLHLSGNAILARSLRHLAPAIQAASADIEVIDLSNNEIGAETAQDAASWETFLTSLATCTQLHTLALNKNQMAACRTFEIFSRVYLTHFKVAVVAWINILCGGGNVTALCDTTEVKEDDDSDSWLDLAEESADLSLKDRSTRKSRLSAGKARGSDVDDSLACQKITGLASVAIIDLSDSFATDEGVMWLSWTIQRHRWAQEKMFHRTWGCRTDGCAVLSANTTNEGTKEGHGETHYLMTPEGRTMIRLAEAIPYEGADTASIEEFLQAPVFIIDENKKPTTPKKLVFGGSVKKSRGATNSATRASLGCHLIDRRISDASSMGDERPIISFDGASKAESGSLRNTSGTTKEELLKKKTEAFDQLRIKFQRSILRENGLGATDLWHPAIKLLCYTRAIMVFGPQEMCVLTSEQDGKKRSIDLTETCEKEARKPPPVMRIRSPPIPATTYAAKLLGRQSVTQRDKVEVPAPQTYVFTAPSARRKSARSSAETSRDTPVSSPSTPTCSNVRKLELPKPHSRMVGPLPEEACRIVLGYLADPQGYLSEAQKQNVLEYGEDRSTLAEEVSKGRLGKEVNHQIWIVLEKMDCLMYKDELDNPDTINCTI